MLVHPVTERSCKASRGGMVPTLRGPPVLPSVRPLDKRPFALRRTAGATDRGRTDRDGRRRGRPTEQLTADCLATTCDRAVAVQPRLGKIGGSLECQFTYWGRKYYFPWVA